MALEGIFSIGDDKPRSWAAPPSKAGSGRRPLTIGLVNNMPDAALSATEAQFRRLLAEGAGERAIRLKLFSLPSVVRSEAAVASMAGAYASTDTLARSGVDALIVTGAEPLAADLRDEPYWADLSRLVDWAARSTVSTLWSCLAAHAAVLHLDGISRHPLPAKLSGVFEVRCAARHPLIGRAGLRRTPHSRLNTLAEADLAACGYRVLTRSDEIGADMFVREYGALFVFLQGHPEYDADSLALEYRRDVRRFLRGERAIHPGVPANYFDPATERALAALAAEATAHPRMAILSECARHIASAPPSRTWAASTTALYRNWFSLIGERVDAKAGVCA
jgi:homoserine O-succinyltransferase